MAKRRNLAADLAKSRAARVSGAGTTGLQAMTLGLVLGGCVAVGYFAGAWADGRFGTTLWTPVGVLLGMAAGFREMFLTLKRISAQTKWPGAAASSRDSELSGAVTDAANAGRTAESKASTTVSGSGETEPKARQRLFQVPEPPTASFDSPPAAKPVPAADTNEGDSAAGEDVLRELMGAEAYDRLQAELKAGTADDAAPDEPEQNNETGNTGQAGHDRD
jgi:F0F1-type ATP synthase assembly protein I